MTLEEKRAYQRGYNRAAKWPEHIPPLPPNEIVAQLMKACREMRDGIDAELAQLGPDDEWEGRFGPLIDACDYAMTMVTKWLKKELEA